MGKHARTHRCDHMARCNSSEFQKCYLSACLGDCETLHGDIYLHWCFFERKKEERCPWSPVSRGLGLVLGCVRGVGGGRGVRVYAFGVRAETEEMGRVTARPRTTQCVCVGGGGWRRGRGAVCGVRCAVCAGGLRTSWVGVCVSGVRMCVCAVCRRGVRAGMRVVCRVPLWVWV